MGNDWYRLRRNLWGQVYGQRVSEMGHKCVKDVLDLFLLKSNSTGNRMEFILVHGPEYDKHVAAVLRHFWDAKPTLMHQNNAHVHV